MTTTRLRLVALIAGIAALVLSVAPGTASARRQVGLPTQVAAPVFSFPSNGASYPANGPYLFQIQPVSGAKGYLWSFVQNGMIVYQNLAWDGRLSPSSYTVSTRSQAHRLIHAGDLHVWVRAMMKNGHWSGTGAVMVRIQGQGGPHPNPAATPRPKATATPQATATPAHPAPGTVLYRADTSGGLDKLQEGNGWKHLDGMLVNDGSGGFFFLPYTPAQPDYAVEVEYQVVSHGGGGASFGLVARGLVARAPGNDCVSGYWAGVQGDGTLFLNSGYIFCDESSPIGSGPSPSFPIDGNFHTLRLEVKSNQETVLYDGSVILRAVDNSHLAAGQVGLWSTYFQVNIRAIRVIAL